ncbi:MAG: type II toxin-antitoxin system HicA family toxin [Oscillospiraceae bacterium]|jgi:hypothetical protein|nr:type II toxin-antitoxin system HicA family toxin [Oscillospiraceae bacterium]
MDDYIKNLKKILFANNCNFVRYGKGDYDIWYSPIKNCEISVDRKIKSQHTANQILKDAGIKYNF